MLELGLGTSGSSTLSIATVTNAKSILFDGTDDEILITALNLTGAFSISVWIKPDDVTSYDAIIGRSDANYYLRINSDANTLHFLTASGTVALDITSSPLVQDEWNHLVLTRDGSNGVTIYRNGAAVDTASLAGTVTYDSIGAKNSEGYFGGYIDEIAVWDVELPSNAVSTIYNNGKANVKLTENTYNYSSASDLQNWWRMGDGDLDDGNIDDNGLIGDQTDATLGSELFNGSSLGANLFISIGGGVALSLTYLGGEDKIWTVEGEGGDTVATFYLSDKTANGGLSADLTADSWYKITFEAKESSGNVDIQVRGANTNVSFALTSSYVEYTTYLLADDSPGDTDHYIRFTGLGDTEVGKIRSISVKKVGGNPGGMIAMETADGGIKEETP